MAEIAFLLVVAFYPRDFHTSAESLWSLFVNNLDYGNKEHSFVQGLTASNTARLDQPHAFIC